MAVAAKYVRLPMAIKNEDIIYVLTKEDVDDVAEKIGISNLTDRHYHYAEKYISSFCSDGPYTWVNAIEDALHDAEMERKGEYPEIKPE